MKHECPYHARFSKTCTHKGCHTTRKGKRYCIYKDHSKCKLYQEWLDTLNNKKRLKFEASKRLKTTNEVEDE